MQKKILYILILFNFVCSIYASGNVERNNNDISVWEIPFLNSLTGPIASIGEYLQWGAEFAAEQINDAGGISGKPVKIVRIDTGMSSERGTFEMSKLVKDAIVVMGPVPESVIMAAVPIAAEGGLYSFTATTSFKYASKYFPWAISWFSPTEEKLPPIVTAWAEKVGANRVVQFVENYGAWPGMAAAHEIGLEEAGCNVLQEVDVPTDAVSFGSAVVKALSQDPDAIIFACKAEKVAKIIIELKNRGWNDMNKMLVFSSADSTALYTIGGDKINGVMIYNYNDPSLNTARWNEFRQRFKDDHEGNEPFSLSPNYYDAVYMIKRAIEETGVTGDPKKLVEERIKIRDYCNDIKRFEGLQYEWSNKDGYPVDKPLFLYEIKEGVKYLSLKIPDEEQAPIQRTLVYNKTAQHDSSPSSIESISQTTDEVSATIEIDSYNTRIRNLQELYNEHNFTVPPIVTVMNLKSNGLSDLETVFISDYISSSLYNTRVYRIIDRNQRETLLKELSFSLSGCSDESCSLEVGKLLSADKIVVGNIGKISTRYIFDLKLIDVTSGETLSVSNNIYTSIDQLIDDCKFIALDLTEEFLSNSYN